LMISLNRSLWSVLLAWGRRWTRTAICTVRHYGSVQLPLYDMVWLETFLRWVLAFQQLLLHLGYVWKD